MSTPHVTMTNGSSHDVEPIAVIGMGCRMPGNVRSPSDFWNLLISRGIANTPKMPGSRFNIDAYLHPSNERPGSFNVPGGYFIDGNPYDFNPGMFNISPVEASWMDPQQRLLLEVVYEAFENSGTTLDEASGQKTGCFIGSFTFDFQQSMAKEPDFLHAYFAMGADPGLLGNRVSYVYNLTGPSLTVNTACSSSLYALDLACKSLASGECDSAIVGGTNLILDACQHMCIANMGVLSSTNTCHTFDASADGYGRAEGVGALYLKPLSAAIRDGDPVRAVIRATASGSSGRCKDGLAHPSVEGQVEIIKTAYRLAKLSPEDTTYVECHGTGTPIGDPIEVKAVHDALGVELSKSNPILIGSVKPNVGHSEAASSMATLIKTIMALENGIIPPTAGVNQLNPSIPWEDFNVRVATEPTPFPASKPIRRISVNAFGYGGTNAHAILESAQSMAPGYRTHKIISQASKDTNGSIHRDLSDERAHLLVFSAHDEATLRNNLTNYSNGCNDKSLIDLAYTLGVRRTKFSHRTFAIARKESLESDITAASVNITQAPSVPAIAALVFTGQGAQWPRMGASLMEAYPSVLQTIQRLDRHLSTLAKPPTWKIQTVITTPEEESVINEPEFSQPICTAVQIAVVDLLNSWGVKPVATVGHSSGEMAAAYAAGLVSAESAIAAAYYRGKAVASCAKNGAMLAVGLGANSAKEYIQKASGEGRINIACHNSPNNTTLSGDRDVLEQLKQNLDAEGIFNRMLQTGGNAYHSYHMKDITPIYAEYLGAEPVPPRNLDPKCSMFSTVQAKEFTNQNGNIPGSWNSYWVENLSSSVLFRQSVQLMLDSKPEVNLLIEVGPHPALSGPLKEICQAADRPQVTYLSTLKRKQSDVDQLLQLAGNLWLNNAKIDMRQVTGVERLTKSGAIETETGLLLVDLPAYDWERTRYLSEPRFSKERREAGEPRHDLLGRRIIGTSSLEPIWRNILRQRDVPWLSHHSIAGEILLPATAYIALAIEAITQLNAQQQPPVAIESYTLRDITIHSATVIPDDDEGTETMLRLQPTDKKSKASGDSQWYQFTASCNTYGTWKTTAEGRICVNLKAQDTTSESQALHKARSDPGTIPIEYDDWFSKLQTLGINLGSTFHRLHDIYVDTETSTVYGGIDISQKCGLMEAESRYILHPGVIDACLQPYHMSRHEGRIEDMRYGMVPTHFEEVTVFTPSEESLAHPCTFNCLVSQRGIRACLSSSQIFTRDGSLLVDISGCRTVQYHGSLSDKMYKEMQRDLFLQCEWKVDVDYLKWANDAGLFNQNSLATIIDALLHKDITTRVLCLDHTLVPSTLAMHPAAVLTVLGPVPNDTLAAQYVDDERIVAAEIEALLLDARKPSGGFGLVIGNTIDQTDAPFLERIRKLVAPDGHLLFNVENKSSEEWDRILRDTQFSGVEFLSPDGALLTTAVESAPKVNGVSVNGVGGHGNLTLVYRDAPTSLLAIVSEKFTNEGWNVRSQAITSLDIPPQERVILLADAEGPFLAEINEAQLKGLIDLSQKASVINWVSCGGLLSGDKPDFAMTEGAARVIRNERESLDLVTIDFDVETTSEARVAELLADILKRQSARGQNGETEYYVKGGVVYINRLVSCRDINREFVPDSGETKTLLQKDLPEVSGRFNHGRLEFYRDQERFAKPLGESEVEVHVESLGITSADGTDDAPFLNHQIAGTVTRVSSGVASTKMSTRVFGFALDHLATFQRTSSALLQAIPQGCSLPEAASLPSPFTTVLYGLEELARIEPDENVVLIDNMGDVTLAAIQLCRLHQANAIVVTSSSASQELLLTKEGLTPTQIIDGREGSISPKVNKSTAGKGIDVVLCAAGTSDEMISELGHHMSSFGRIVAFGTGQNGDPKVLRPPTNRKSINVFQFNLTDLVQERPRIVARLLTRCVDLYTQGKITGLNPIHVRKPSDYNEIVRSGLRDVASGSQVISYDESVSFEVVPTKRPLKLKPDVTYFLVGGLGGIGRRLAIWMADQGAKHLAFISRSGATRPAAEEMIKALEDRGVDVSVVRSDATSREELADAISQINVAYPIRGVVNAAGEIFDGMFDNMTFERWRKTVDSKYKSCRNLHELLKDQELDFFVITSSIAALLGSTGQSNYSAANSYLDSLARHRRVRGLPAVSLDLPAIDGFGYIHEHSLEQSVKMRGLYSIDEKELLEAFEIAMAPQQELPRNVDHIAVGLQPRRFERSMKMSGAHIGLSENPYFNWLAAAMESSSQSAKTESKLAAAGSAESILTVMQAAGSEEEAVEAVTTYVTQRLARLLMIEVGRIQTTEHSVAEYGLDSMIGAEFRNWIFREFGVDIPFQQLLASTLTLSKLAQTLYEKVNEGGK
ncbi:ketoacyl-synt-domain-containing protein [Daldinia bambusicola]|nr:ketoacyl-synt-domain-containing protein [Daldinia bambusicola]